ncbi:MAG: hypothetical protein HPY67_06760 [Syntrophaceae bacterium]|nr:hypothetical protein [Syntrophaceae bacterium]
MMAASRKFWLGWLGLLFLASVMMFGCGGGGGGDAGGGGGGTPAPTVPVTINYSIGTSDNPLVATFAPEGVTFTLTSIRFTGTLNRDTGDLTLDENRSMAFTLPSPFIEEATLSIGILTPSGSGGIVSPGNQQYPTRGALQINVASGVTGFDRVMGEITATGVRISAYQLNDLVAGPVDLTWLQFEALENDAGAAPYLRVARYSYSAIEFIFEQFSLAYLLVALVFEYDDQLQSSRSIVGNSAVFPGTGRAGTLRVDWQDTTGNGDLGPGDRFVGTFSEFWVDDPTDDVDRMYDGVLTLSGYIENPNSLGGAFVFSNFRERETQGNMISPDSTIVNGGFDVIFSW